MGNFIQEYLAHRRVLSLMRDQTVCHTRHHADTGRSHLSAPHRLHPAHRFQVLPGTGASAAGNPAKLGSGAGEDLIDCEDQPEELHQAVQDADCAGEEVVRARGEDQTVYELDQHEHLQVHPGARG